MRSIDFLSEEFGSNRFRGQLLKTYYVGRNGRPIPPEHRAFLDRHVKQLDTSRGNYTHRINQYNDDWYFRTPLPHNITDWDTMWRFVSQYYSR